MFSFFRKKTEISPSEEIPIPGPNPQNHSNASDFIFIENNHQLPKETRNNYMYPLVSDPQYFPSNGLSSGGVKKYAVINSLDGVPFSLASTIHRENSFENQQSYVDHILATITRAVSIDETKEYDFSLERSVMGM